MHTSAGRAGQIIIDFAIGRVTQQGREREREREVGLIRKGAPRVSLGARFDKFLYIIYALPSTLRAIGS